MTSAEEELLELAIQEPFAHFSKETRDHMASLASQVAISRLDPEAQFKWNALRTQLAEATQAFHAYRASLPKAARNQFDVEWQVENGAKYTTDAWAD